MARGAAELVGGRELAATRLAQSRLVSTTLYLRPDQVVDLARISADTNKTTADFVRDAIDAAITSALNRPAPVPLLRGKNLLED